MKKKTTPTWYCITYYRKTNHGGETTTLWAPDRGWIMDAVKTALRDGVEEIEIDVKPVKERQ